MVVKNQLRRVASGQEVAGVMKINQDANVFVAYLESGKQMNSSFDTNRQGYLVCIDGKFSVDGIGIQQRDALKIWGEQILTFTAQEDSQFLLVELAS